MKAFVPIFVIGTIILVIISVFLLQNKGAQTIETNLTSNELTHSESPLTSPTSKADGILPSELIDRQQEFIDSKGVKKQLTELRVNDSSEMYINQGEFVKDKAIKINFDTTERSRFMRFQYPILESPGPKKYFFVIISHGGDSGKSAIFDEDGKIISEYIDDEVRKAIKKNFGDEFVSSYSEGTFWIDPNTIFIRYASYAEHDHEFLVKFSTSAVILEIQRIPEF